MSENDNLPVAEEPVALAADHSEQPAPEVVISVPEPVPAPEPVAIAEPVPVPAPAPEPAKKIKNNNPVVTELETTTLAGEGVKLI